MIEIRIFDLGLGLTICVLLSHTSDYSCNLWELHEPVVEETYSSLSRLQTIPSLPSITISEAYTHEEDENSIELEEQSHLLSAQVAEIGSRSSVG